MVKPSWRSELTAELRKQRLPETYIRRYLAEMDEHVHDLTQENQGMDAAKMESKMGRPSELAQQAARTIRSRTFAGRHPVIAFLVAPIPLSALLAIGYMLGILALGWGLTAIWPDHDATAHVDGEGLVESLCLNAIGLGYCYLPFLAASALLCRSAGRSGVGLRWPLAACLVVALLAVCSNYNFTLRTSDHKGLFMVGFGIGWFGWTQALQFLAPLAIWSLSVARQRSQARRSPQYAM